VVVVKDLPVKGAPKAIKAGTKVRGIRLVDGDHNIDCKVDGFGAMALKSEFVKKPEVKPSRGGRTQDGDRSRRSSLLHERHRQTPHIDRLAHAQCHRIVGPALA
jgi:hypothetical protein